MARFLGDRLAAAMGWIKQRTFVMLELLFQSDVASPSQVCSFYGFNDIFYCCQVFLQAAHKNIIMVGAGNLQ